MLTVSNYSKSFDGKEVLKQVSLSLMENQIIGIWGKNGSGKSTLIKAILGFYNNDFSGNIVIKPNVKLAYVPQSPEEFLLPWKTCISNLKLHYPSIDKKNAIAHLLSFGLEETEVNKYPFQLSGGNLQRLSWACSLLPNKNLILLDEPFSKQDRNHSGKLIAKLRVYISGQSKSGIIISHDPQLLIKCSDRIFLFNSSEDESVSIINQVDLSIDECDRTNINLPHNEYLDNLFSIYT